MAFLTKKHLSRRTFLNGRRDDGAAVSRVHGAGRNAAPADRRRGNQDALGRHLLPHGATMDKWTPAAEGTRLRAVGNPAAARAVSRSREDRQRSEPPAGVRRRFGDLESQPFRGDLSERRACRGRSAGAPGDHGRPGRGAEDWTGHGTPVTRADYRRRDVSAAATASAARTATRFPGRSPLRRCRCRTIRRWSSSGCSGTAAPMPNDVPRRSSRSACWIPCWVMSIAQRTLPPQTALASTSIRMTARDRAADRRSRRQVSVGSDSARSARRRSEGCRRAHQIDVRPAGARLAGGHHARHDAADRQGVEQRRVCEERRRRCFPHPVASFQPAGEHGSSSRS